MLLLPADPQKAAKALGAINVLRRSFGTLVHDGDGFLAFSRNASFTRDPRFAAAVKRVLDPNAPDRRWALHILTWALESTRSVPGGVVFVGGDPREFAFLLAAEPESLAARPIRVFLDREEFGADDTQTTPIDWRTFSTLDRDRVLQEAPRQIAMLVAGAPKARSELSVLEALFDRLEPGALLIIQDFGAAQFTKRHVDFVNALRGRGVVAMEIATTQGLAIWR